MLFVDKKIRPALALTACALALLLAACGQDTPTPGPTAGGAAPTVTEYQVRSDEWIDQIEALGTARANESVTLTAKVTEVVRRVRFDDGDRVRQGDVLVELTGQAEVANLREAQASLNEAQQQLQRLEPLVEQGTLPRAQLDTQRALRDSARARADAIRARLAERVISAPFDGVLGFRQVSDGALVTPGTVIATLDDIDTIKLDFTVPERYLSTLASGQAIVARSIAWPDQPFNGVVTSIGSRVDPVSRAITLRAELANPEHMIKPGMLLTVDLATQPRQTLVIPELALVQVGTRQSVFRLDADDTVTEVEVRAGARRLGEVEIVAGLQPGERIVHEGSGKLRNGLRVTVVEPQAAGAAVARSAD